MTIKRVILLREETTIYTEYTIDVPADRANDFEYIEDNWTDCNPVQTDKDTVEGNFPELVKVEDVYGDEI